MTRKTKQKVNKKLSNESNTVREKNYKMQPVSSTMKERKENVPPNGHLRHTSNEMKNQ